MNARSGAAAKFFLLMVFGSSDILFGNSCSNIIDVSKIANVYSMIDMNGGLSDDIQQYIPNTCSNSPSPGQAFCKPHCEAVSAMGKFKI